ncbi:MAG: polyhydroxyalkanoate synthesis repressor PhaR [Gammaproteobacteria bacterium]|nr:polyhydroxyalkanoate synthesis repressor PhaR [Gammaproteobacteria bacterium]MCP5139587.1 polyhydroxyalkanoate synthesis repressor PhaR [Chromatiales bacterium]
MPRTVKKYANRRLYDTEASRHVTLDGIRQLVAGGEDVVVIDDTTGEDITRSILLQVISEQEQGGRPILSAEMLRHIIRFYGNPLQELMGGYLERSLDVFMKQQKSLQDQIQKSMGALPLGMTPPHLSPLGSMQDMAAKNIEAWTRMQKTFLDMMMPRPTAEKSKDKSTDHKE